MTTTSRIKLGELLLKSGAIDALQLEAALGHQRKWGGRLGEIVVEMRFTGDDRICGALARQLGIPAVDLAAREIPKDVVNAVPREVCEKYGVFPFELVRDPPGRISVAMSDPLNLEAVDDLRFLSGLTVSVAIAPTSAVHAAIRHYFYGEDWPATGPTLAATPGPASLETPTPPPAADPPVDMVVVDLADLFEESSALTVRGPESQRIAYLQQEVIARIEDLAQGRGGAEPVPPWKVLAALVRHLVRQGVIRDASFLDEVARS